MSRDRRFGLALLVLALGNAMLALGNYAIDGVTVLMGAEGVMALGMAALGYSFRYGHSELAVEADRERLVGYATILVAAVGVVLAIAGFAMVLSV